MHLQEGGEGGKKRKENKTKTQKNPARWFGEGMKVGKKKVEIHDLSVNEAFTPTGAGTDPSVDSTVMVTWKSHQR